MNGMGNISSTDSYFSPDESVGSQDNIWKDLRLLHESERGWCVVYSGVFNGRRFALKVLKEQYRESELHINLLKKEYTIGKMMVHPNVLVTVGLTTVPGLGTAIVMEHIEGVTLSQYISENPSLSEKEIERLIEQICSGVSFIHSRQIVHCDLKPSNIMIIEDGGYVKIIDFGVSRGTGFEQLNFPGGTSGFTAPENMDLNGSFGTGTDIYSIGRIIESLDRKKRWKSIVRRCTAESPSDRPERVRDIPVLMERCRNRMKYQREGLAVAILVAVVTSGLILFSYNSGKNDSNDKSAAADKLPVDILKSGMKGNASELKDSVDNGQFVSESLAPFIVQMLPGSHIDEDKKRPSQDTVQLIYSKVKEKVKVNEVISDDSLAHLPFEKQLYSKAISVSERRFAEHLILIDTMTTQKSNMLQLASHWRWLANQDMKQWISKRIPESDPRYKEVIKKSEKIILDFSNRFSTVYEDSYHKKQSERKRGIKNYSYPSKIRKELSDGRISEEFPREEDGVIVKRIIDEKGKIISEEVVEFDKSEYNK